MAHGYEVPTPHRSRSTVSSALHSRFHRPDSIQLNTSPFHKRLLQPRKRINYACPSWQTFHRLGIETSKQLPPHATYDEIARAVGLSTANTYHECMVALGKVVFAFRGMMRDGSREG